MRIKIDTGSRLDQSGDTTFGFSNDAKKAVLLRQTVRDQCFQKLQGSNLQKQLRLFAACVYLLIQDHLSELTEITIDLEYPGHEQEIVWMLLNILKRREQLSKRRLRIKVKRIGKKSSAHKVAWETLRKKRQPAKRLTASEIIAVLL